MLTRGRAPPKLFSALVCFYFSEEYGLEAAAFQIIRGGVVPMDLATVQLSDGTSMYMTLLSSWGFVADIDIESEKFRKIGKVRFVLGGWACVCGWFGYLVASVAPSEWVLLLG